MRLRFWKKKIKSSNFDQVSEEIQACEEKEPLLILKSKLEGEVEYYKSLSLVGLIFGVSSPLFVSIISVLDTVELKTIIILCFWLVAVVVIKYISRAMKELKDCLTLRGLADTRLRIIEETKKKQDEMENKRVDRRESRLPPRRIKGR